MSLSLLIAAALALQMPPQGAAVPQAVGDRLSKCGIARSAVTWGVDEIFGEPQAVIAGGSEHFPDSMLLCAMNAGMEGNHSTRFADEAADGRAQALRQARWEAELRQGARAWLAERNLLERLTDHDPEQETLAAYARSMEALCGVAPGAVLAADEPGMLTLHGIVADPIEPDDRFTCLANAFLASNLIERGVVIGMIGREVDLGQR